MARKIENFELIMRWKRDNKILIQKMFPRAKDKDIDKGLSYLIDKFMVKTDMKLNNTYQEKELYSDTLDVSEYYFKCKPATAGNGVLVDPTKFNPALKMLEAFKSNRDQFKKERQQFPEDSFEFADRDLKQGNEKVKMNAWYGINGSPTCIFFNLECATGKVMLVQKLFNCWENFDSISAA